MHIDTVKILYRWARNKRRIRRLRRLLANLALVEDPEITIHNEKALIEEVLKLSPSQKRVNSPLLQPMHLYLAGLYHKGRLSLDHTVHNVSIEFFTDSFLQHADKIKKIFYYHSLQKVLQMLIVANLSIHRVQHATKLLDAYFVIFTGTYKALLYIRILSATCGRLDMNKVIELFDDVSRIYRDECTTVSAKASFVTNIYILSKGVNMEVPHFDTVLDSFCALTIGDGSYHASRFYKELCYCNDCLDRVGQWLASLSPQDKAKASVAAVTALYEGRQQNQIDISVDTREIQEKYLEIAELACEDEDAFDSNILQRRWRKLRLLPKKEKAYNIGKENAAIRANLLKKEYSLESLVDEIDSAIELYRVRSRNEKTLDRQLLASNFYYSLSLLRSSVVFWRDLEKNFLKVVAAESDKEQNSVFFFTNEYSLVNGAVTFPFLLEARRRGIKCYSVSPQIHLDSSLENEAIYDFYGFSVGGQDKRFFMNKDMGDAEIDVAHKRIIVQGMNVYQPIFEFVTRYQFTYFYNYEDDAWARYRTTLLVRTFDRLFRYIEKIEKWAIDNHKHVYFISNAPHLHIAAAYRIYCEEHGADNHLNFICTSPGYDNYFLNAADPQAETTTALNLTKHPLSRNSFLGTKEMFDSYYEANKSRIADIRNKMQVHLEAERGRKRKEILFRQKQDVFRQIKEAKEQGKVIILLNGKVIIDLAVKYTQGCVHADMSDWISHAVSFSKQHSDSILLLIKPHPHENREDLTLTSETIDNLYSLIRCKLGDNTIFLDNDMFTNHEIIGYVDLGMVWNGTSALEFAAQGKKVLVGDVWGHYDYPIGFVWPRTLEEYESYMLNPGSLLQPSDIQDRAITFLEYMGSSKVCIPNPYAQTTLMNFNQYGSVIKEEAVDKFVSNGGGQLLKEYFDMLL